VCRTPIEDESLPPPRRDLYRPCCDWMNLGCLYAEQVRQGWVPR
jgi:hypothetical protein